MANNTTLNTMTGGDVIADEDISAVKYQLVKLVDGTAGSVVRIGGELDGLWVVDHKDLKRIPVTSGGLTTSTTAYVNGDQVGTQFTFVNAARTSGEGGMIVGAAVIDAADIVGSLDLFLFDSTVTLAADNAAFTLSDADALKVVGIVPLAAFDIGANRLIQMFNLAIPYICTGTSLFGAVVTRSAHTFFAAATDLQVNLYVERN